MRLARFACVCLAAVSIAAGGTGPGEEATWLERVGRLEEECAALRCRVTELEGLLEQLAAESRQLRGEISDLYRMRAAMAALARGSASWVHLPPVALVPGAVSGLESVATEESVEATLMPDAAASGPVSIWDRDAGASCPELYDTWGTARYQPLLEPADPCAGIGLQESGTESDLVSSCHDQSAQEPGGGFDADWAAQYAGEDARSWAPYEERYDYYRAAFDTQASPQEDTAHALWGECAESDPLSPVGDEPVQSEPVYSAWEAPEALAPAVPAYAEPAPSEPEPSEPACPVLWEEPSAPEPVSPPSEPADTACEDFQWTGDTYGHDDAPDAIMRTMELCVGHGAQECVRADPFGTTCVVASAAQTGCDQTVPEER